MHLRELFLKEDDRATAVFAFGRFNPPTIGHQKLIEKVQSMAKQVNGKGFIFLSHKQNNKTDPLLSLELLFLKAMTTKLVPIILIPIAIRYSRKMCSSQRHN